MVLSRKKLAVAAVITAMMCVLKGEIALAEVVDTAGRWCVDVEKSPGVGLSTSGGGSNRDQPSCTETVIWTLTLMP